MSDIQQRIKTLKELMEAEENSPHRSQAYIDDCKLTLAELENKLDNGWKGYEMVKGNN